MPLPSVEYLQHILDETTYLASRAKGLTKDEFMKDETLKRAFVRSLEIIGEAAKNVSAESDKNTATLTGQQWLECETD
jgi:uncharacterized protein with HEPN domain